MTNEVIKAMIERRSCRKFKAEQIKDEELQAILEAGKYAATGKGLQSPKMVVIQNPEIIKRLSKLNAAIMDSENDPFYGAPTVVVVLGDSTIGTYLEDGALVMGNLLNAANAVGVDSCWIHRAKEVFMSTEGKELLKQWGIDDVPVIIQDKQFSADGQVDYQLDIMTAAVGWFGDTLLTNGAIYPQHAAPRGWLRLRLLNGCNARSLNIAASDNRPLYVIASDGGLLAEPVKVTELPMLMGERFEVLVDVSDGKAFDLVTLPVSQMGMAIAPFDKPHPVMRVQPLLITASGTLPDTLTSMPSLPSLEGLTVRKLQLSMDPMLDMMGMQMLMKKFGGQAMAGMDHGKMMGHMNNDNMDHGNMNHGNMNHGEMGNMQHGNMGNMKHGGSFDFHNANRINGQAFDMNKPMFAAAKGQHERWVISGQGDMMLHPFHIHGTQFRILSENGKAPAAHRAGWKDTVRVEGGVSEVLVKFDHDAPKEHAYMAHCHLLEHEDTGMMLGFTV